VSILQRMILGELIKVFLMSLTALTGMFLLGGLIQEAAQKGLSPTQILVAIPLIIPNTFPYTIPATTLFATCVVYGRMSADNEVLVLRAAGVNIYRLLFPAILLGLGTTAITGAMYYDIIPRSQRLLREQLLKDAEEVIYSLMKREGGMRQNNLDFVMFVRDVQGKYLIDVVVKKRKPDKTGYEFAARSKTAQLRVERAMDNVTVGPEGTQKIAETDPKAKDMTGRPDKKPREPSGRYELVVRMDGCFVDYFSGQTSGELNGVEYRMALPDAIFGKNSRERPSAQTWNELFLMADDFKEERADVEKQVQALEAKGSQPSTTPGKTNQELANEIRNGGLKHLNRMVRSIYTEMQMRPALAVGCIVFCLIGCPVGIWASRSDYLSVFIICFLPVVFFYYPILLAGLNLAKEGKVPTPAAWVANVIAFLTGLVLIKRLMKR
jgi:lipopolysaccharide export system permease protein